MIPKSFVCSVSGKNSFLTCHSFAEALVNADVNPTTITCHLQLQAPESLVPLDSLVHLVPLVVKVPPDILVPQVPLVHAVWSDLLVPLDLSDLLDQLVLLVED